MDDVATITEEKNCEPSLIIFQDDGISQILLTAEKQVIMEMPTTRLIDGFIILMATYYVFDVCYPKHCKQSLLFFQDILMESSDYGSRPTRYYLLLTFNFFSAVHYQFFICMKV